MNDIHNNDDDNVVYWHRDLPPLDAELMTERTVEATSSRVPGRSVTGTSYGIAVVPSAFAVTLNRPACRGAFLAHLISSAEPAATAPGRHSGAVRSNIGHGGTVPPGLSKHRSTDQHQASRRERVRGRAACLRIEVGDNGRNPQPCAKFRVAFNPDPGRDVTAAHEIPAMTLSFLLPVVP